MTLQLEDFLAKARTVAETWTRLKANTKADTTIDLSKALDDLVDAALAWTLATAATERVEPLPDLTTVRITGGAHLGRTGVVLMRHPLVKYEVEVFDGDTGDSLGTFAIGRDWLEPALI